jgi:hypothetical protein
MFYLFLIIKIPEIMVSKKRINEEFIGDIYYLDKNKVDINVKDLLRNGKREIIELEETNPFDIIVLPNNKLIIPDTNNKYLALYDQNFKLIKKIDRINGDMIYASRIALNQKECKIYFSDFHNHRILMTDLELNLIKTIGSRGNENYQFKYPRGMCICRRGLLYITDYLNDRVQIFSKNLEYIKTLKVDFRPSQIKASNYFLCSKNDSSRICYFYDLNDLSFYQKIECNGSILSEINSSIYLYDDSSEKKVCCFNDEGEIDEEISLNGIDTNYNAGYYDGSIIEFNGSLLMTFKSAKRIIRFSK